MRQIDLSRWSRYFELRNEGHSVEKSARGSKIDPKTAWKFERGEPGSTGVEVARHLGIEMVAGLEVAPDIGPEAKRALEDFGYFRRRYMGRNSLPWQEKAAYIVLERLSTPDREYVVMNAPPGAGKSTLFTHDIPAWLLVRDRAMRIQFGSATGRLAVLYVGRLKRTLEREVPMQARPEEAEAGISFDAEATLSGDYGAFKPEGRSDLWRAEALNMRQFGGQALDDKEPNVSGWGADTKFLGGRFDFVIWDDLVDNKNSANSDRLAALIHLWSTEFETRLDPGGLMVLQGQRIAPGDLYQHCVEMVNLEGERKYTHVRFQAHDDARCEDKHSAQAAPWPTGCLLDPHRLPWKFLSSIAANEPRTYDIQYQQNNGGNTAKLVQLAWLDGTRDLDGIARKGCYDTDRKLGETTVKEREGWSVVSVDPSPSRFWGITHWIALPGENRYELVNVVRKPLGSEQFLSMDLDDHTFSGVLEDLRVHAVSIGHPLTAVIVEVNAAQKFLLAQPHFQRWAQVYDITPMPHTTGINKADPEFGVTSVADYFRQGAIRLPMGDDATRRAVGALTLELLAWPEGLTDDLVMSVWFFIRAVQLTYMDPKAPAPRFNRPSWLGTGRSLESVYRS